MENLKIIFTLLLIFSTNLFAHTIYAPNDIPLLDNRFRLDPKTQSVTIILNHSKGRQIIVLIRPDGSKMFKQKHSDNVAWVSTAKNDIITITKPMIGPWQAIANLDDNNRINLVSPVKLNINHLPLAFYSKELFSTTATLTENKVRLVDPGYTSGAKLRISLVGKYRKKVFFYKDNGKKYDSLPFDGLLTARLFIDLVPGKYTFNISTKNDVFVRAINRDAVVLPTPIKIEAIVPETASEVIKFKVSIDEKEIIPTSVIIHGTVTEKANSGVEQIIINATSANETVSKRLTYGDFLFEGKAAATTVSGREIEIKLPQQAFTLLSPQSAKKRKKELVLNKENTEVAKNKKDTGDAKNNKDTGDAKNKDDTEDANKEISDAAEGNGQNEAGSPGLSIFFWIALSIVFVLACVLIVVVILLVKEKMKNKEPKNIDEDPDAQDQSSEKSSKKADKS